MPTKPKKRPVGRPALPGKDYLIRLSDELAGKAEAIGGGGRKRTEGIRIALQAYRAPRRSRS